MAEIDEVRYLDEDAGIVVPVKDLIIGQIPILVSGSSEDSFSVCLR